MKREEVLRHPVIKETANRISRMLARNIEMSANTRNQRAEISELKIKFPRSAAIERLTCLLDQRIVILEELTSSFERWHQIILTAGQVSDEPVEEMKRLMDTIRTNQTILESLIGETEKITPESEPHGGLN